MSCHFNEDENSQLQIFQYFYSLLSWTEKTDYVQSRIEISECKKRRKPENRRNIRFKKLFTRKYFFSDKNKNVCKSFFKSVLQISEGRLEKCVKKKQNLSLSSTVDLRGKHNAHRKTPIDRIKEVIQFINLLPQYESHYTRAALYERKYLSPELNLKILFNEYIKWCNEKSSQPVSQYMFRDIFYRRFNLKFKQPAQDTCDCCNKLKMKIAAAALKSDERLKLMEEKFNHLEIVEKIHQEYKDYVSQSKLKADSTIVLVFDLEKVFQTSKLSTNSAYYKRKLSTYNLCIHDCTHNRSYMYIWHEAIASRGPPEVTSCLLYHFQNYIPKGYKDLVLYSDSTGAQNRNIKTSVILSQYLEKNEHLQTITQHFYRPGHSYNVCDIKFGIIEKKCKKATDIYVPNQWTKLIAESKITHPKFIVTELNTEHFKSCDKLLAEYCTNRKMSMNNEPVNWFTFRKIMLIKGQPLILFTETYEDVKTKYNDAYEFKPENSKAISIVKKGFDRNAFISMELPLLYPQGRPIATAKKKDLMDLLEFIPQTYHKFYVQLDHVDMDPNDIIMVSDSEEDK